MNSDSLTRNLVAILDRADELDAKRVALSKRLVRVRRAKEDAIEKANPDNEADFARVTEIGSQEQLLIVAVDKNRRELDGIGATALNEGIHVQRTSAGLLKAEIDKRDSALEADLAKHWPEGSVRKAIRRQIQTAPTRVRELSKRRAGLVSTTYGATGCSDPLQFARQILNQTVRALSALNRKN